MRILLQLCCRLMAALPRPVALAWGRRLGWLLGALVRHRRGEVRRALQRAFPERSPAEREELATRMYEHLGLTMAEVARLAVHGPADLAGRFEIVEDEHLRQLAARTEGSLLLMGHIGNWELTSLISTRLARPLHAVVKPLRPAALQRLVAETRGRLGLHLLNHRGDFSGTLRALKRGETVTVILDQNQRRDKGIFVNFLGAPAATSAGLAILSARTRLPVFPLYVHRRADGVHVLRVLAPIAPPPNRDPATLHAATQHYTRVLEDIIRLRPEQWTWLHRRWKTRPPEDCDQRTADGRRRTADGSPAP
jgi:KDO2-lipid IV(A) lauroyltransferase